jgi:diguanylate cyclase (GGDEF)-like protein
LSNLTLRKQFEAELERLAHYDALTGLANRSLLTERINQELVRLRRKPSRVGVLFLDLDRFKPINDTLGHAVGDRVLVETAERIQSCIRAQDTAARIGGDEFVVLLSDFDDVDLALEVADRIASRVEEPFVLGRERRWLGISIGVVITQSPDARAEELIDSADTAMYEAKRRRDVTRVLYTPDMKAHPAVGLPHQAGLRHMADA